MKHIFLFLSCYFSFYGTLRARSEMSEQNTIFRQIAMELQLDNADQVLNIPNRFDEVSSIRQMVKRSPYFVRYLNMLSIVPNSPVIESHVDMVNGLKKYRVFAMSRIPCFDKILSQNGPSKIYGGRYLFLVNMEGSDCNPRWIPEPEVQFILKQLNGFDPEKQPLAFQDLISEEGKGPISENATSNPRNGSDSGQRVRSVPKIVTRAAVAVMTQNLISWLAGLVGLLVILLGYLCWRYFRKKARP